MGPLEEKIRATLSFHLTALPAMQRAFNEGRTLTVEDLTGDGTLTNALMFLLHQNAGLSECVVDLARALDDLTAKD